MESLVPPVEEICTLARGIWPSGPKASPLTRALKSLTRLVEVLVYNEMDFFRCNFQHFGQFSRSSALNIALLGFLSRSGYF